ncbi:hypothetical protein GF373_13175 [bacterium]|nr:hypothetical protein [bacterium]
MEHAVQDNRRQRPLNPCELEIDLFCKGMHIDDSCNLETDSRSFAKARAGLGSGLEIVIPGEKDLWLNVPVFEHFVSSSPYKLIKEKGQYKVVDTSINHTYPVWLPASPEWFNWKTSTGAPMKEIGVLQGTYLGVYVGEVCGFWKMEPKQNCHFCATGIIVGQSGADRARKCVDDVVEVAKVAKEQSNITFTHFNTGYQEGQGTEICAPFVKAIKEKVGTMVGVQAIPTQDLWKYDWLMDLGCDHFSFCYELHNPKFFAEYLPGKQKYIQQETFFKALEYTSGKLGKGRCSGEIIAGIEPIEDTLKAIDYICSVGAFPTVCIFRPVEGTVMENAPSPQYEDMRVVFKHVYESCIKYGVPVGLVPGIEVSLVVQPDDARFLVDKNWPYYLYRAKLAMMRPVAKRIFNKQLKPRTINADADNPPYPTNK